jgi:glutamate carboxypeptidase
VDATIQKLVQHTAEIIDQRLPAYVAELTTLCAIDSPSYHKAGLDAMAAYVAERMQASGMKTTMIEYDTWGNDVLGILYGRGQRSVTLLAHTDTVYPVGVASARPLSLQENRLVGPGVCDMKGCILSALYALAILAERGRDTFREVRFLCVSDEEIGQRHSLDLIRSVCKESSRVFVLEAARADGALVSARKGTAWYLLTARGGEAHAGVEPEKGSNAILELAHQLLLCSTFQGWCDGLTISPGVIQGGTAPNVVPAEASARIDVRFFHPGDLDRVEKRWNDLLREKLIPDVELTLEREAQRTPMVRTPDSMELVRIAQNIAGVLGFSLSHTSTGGTSDASYASDLHIPVLDGLGPIGGLDHSPREYLLLDSIAPRTALLAGLIAVTG